MGNNVRPLDKDYSVDQLASILQLWCRVFEQDLVLGCLMRNGRVNIYDNTTAATGIVWIYKSMNKIVKDLIPRLTSTMTIAEGNADYQKRYCDYTALIAADNLCSMFRLFHLGYYHQKRAATWLDWDYARLKEMEDTLRTGILTSQQQEQLDQYELKELFNTRYGYVSRHINAIEISNNMRKIAAKYTISPDEFDKLCFIDSPSGSRSRVFYPFWHRSRDLAEEVGWDWGALFSFVTQKLVRLRRQCNRHGEKAGLGETDMDRDRVVYWMTHWVCHKIKAIKDANEVQTVEDITWRLVDRWGLPIIP
ncbi:hypothetical protein QBC32DRAFT_216500 [Pseudoneurospora amorphoporcata]|uniref:Uncharacterized protein n=1 Tax=Pseudoneurospora amorphoporcata TaxID=241081 RepID=A0AAN6NRL3_9PEZI|nr:hypothetical protein QBC32DRAFT_216500 [Pseudoneurospora amorphoporcata]